MSQWYYPDDWVCYVYIFSDVDGSVVYVGSTGDLTRRIDAHSESTWWWNDDLTLTYEITVGRRTAFHRESALIIELHPRYNGIKVGGQGVKQNSYKNVAPER
jgi:predicted GIY-YIG superfamily endonuclease